MKHWAIDGWLEPLVTKEQILLAEQEREQDAEQTESENETENYSGRCIV